MKRVRSPGKVVSPFPIPRDRPAKLSRQCKWTRRRGIALLVVLLLVSMALGLSYAAVRSQYTGLQIQGNFNRQISARQAAVTGLTMAIKKIHTGEWAGVDTTLTGSLGSDFSGGDESFQVTYTTGDPSLSSGHPDYEELPYRVTLLSTGSAADPENPVCVATHQIRAVLRLVPRKLEDEPTDWATMQRYTLYQSKNDPFEIDIPCRLEGPVRVQDQLKIAVHYPNDNNAWLRYLGDLNTMRLAGLPDYRPLNGPVDLSFTQQTGSDFSALTGGLGVTANDTPPKATAADWIKPVGLATYQIYPGGPVYTIPSVGTTLENISLEPDPATNPLGIYYRPGSVAIRDNVTIRGSLFCKDNITVEGVNVVFQPVELPALYGSDAPVRVPVASCQNFTVKPTAEGSLTGLLAVFDKFQIDKSLDTVRFAVTGRLITRKFYIKERQPWETADWPALYNDFQVYLEEYEGAAPVMQYFPVWMGYQGRSPEPLLTLKPDSGPITYHWKYPNDRIYVPHPDDASPLDPENPGLRWELLEWTENP